MTTTPTVPSLAYSVRGAQEMNTRVVNLMFLAEDTGRCAPVRPAHSQRQKPAPRTRPTRPIHPRAAPSSGDDLVDRLRAGDPAAFREIADAWSPLMLRLARTFVSTEASAEDIVQETWLQMIRGLNAFEGRSSLRTWVLGILSNLAMSLGAREARSVPWSSVAPDSADLTPRPDLPDGGESVRSRQWLRGAGSNPEEHSPASCAIAGETRQLVAAAIRELPHRQQQVVQLRDVEGRSADDVCADMCISAGNQRILLHRARTVLRSSLAEYYRQA